MARNLVLLVWLLASLVVTVSAQETPDTCTPASGAPIRLGAVFPPETLFSASAADSYRGAAALVEAVNACGGVNGRPVELVYAPAGNRNQVIGAVEQLQDVPLIIGSGSPAISTALLEASRDGDFIYWEVNEPLDAGHEWSFSPRPNNSQLGATAATLLLSLLPDVPIRLALVYENETGAVHAAEGFAGTLEAARVPISIRHSYNGSLSNSYGLAVRMRESGINAVAVAGFQGDADSLWRAMRQADANVSAWIYIGGASYRRNSCQRLGNADGVISVSAEGQVSADYRRGTMGALYEQYATIFRERYGTRPGESADLSASGTYLLLQYILTKADNFDAESIRTALLSTTIPEPVGLLGEGISFRVQDSSFATNQPVTGIVTLRQNGQFCTLFPEALATCGGDMQPFPTWRERARLEAQSSCVDSPFSPPPRATVLPKF